MDGGVAILCKQLGGSGALIFSRWGARFDGAGSAQVIIIKSAGSLVQQKTHAQFPSTTSAT